jgi:hypothetical protein
MLDEPGSGLMGVSFLDWVSFFDLETRFLSDGLPLFVASDCRSETREAHSGGVAVGNRLYEDGIGGYLAPINLEDEELKS